MDADLRVISVRERLEMHTVSKPQDAAEYFVGHFDDRKEYFMALYLDVRHRPVAEVHVVHVGTLAACPVHPREVFRPAIELGAAALIVAHNHPSGDAEPSAEDIDLTERLAMAGDMLGIPLLDHLVLTTVGEGVSIRSNGTSFTMSMPEEVCT